MTVGPSDFTEEDMEVDVIDPSEIDASEIGVEDNDSD